jgi:chorismate--pyruvate lyase
VQYLSEPHWQSILSNAKPSLPASRKDWLLDEGSLTTKLVECCHPGRFHVEVVSQQWQRPLYSEQQLLNMRRGEQAFTRHVILHCDEANWVFARTLIPASSFKGKARRLALLRNKPLGAVLFSDAATRRIDMQVAAINPSHLLYHLAGAETGLDDAELWGRRTLFSYASKLLLVNEIFLPSIPEIHLSKTNKAIKENHKP